MKISFAPQTRPGETTHRWPQVVPGSKAFVYVAHSGLNLFDAATIKLRSLVDGQTKVLRQNGTAGRVVKTVRGNYYFIYVSRGPLYGAAFDIDRMEVTGSDVPLLDGIGSAASGGVEMDVSADGTLIYRSTLGGRMTVQWMDSSGNVQPLLAKPGVYGRPSLSPDGNRLALEVSGANGTDIYVYEPRRDNLSKLTFDKAPAAGPIWSPDSSYIVYQDLQGMSWIGANGGEAKSLLRGTGLQFPWSFSPDGKRLAFMEVGKGGYDLWTTIIGGSAASGITAGTKEPLLITDADDRYPTFSPDGKWVAYASAQGGPFEIYVRPFPDTGAKWQVSNEGGAYPMWSLSTKELLFENGDAQIMAAAWSLKDGAFVAEKPRPWSPKAFANSVNLVKNVSLAPDGKRIAALMPPEEPAPEGLQSHVFFLVNFFDELERRIGPKK